MNIKTYVIWKKHLFTGMISLFLTQSLPALSAANPWDYSCTYKDKVDGNKYEAGSDSLDGAREGAKHECQKGKNDLTNLWNDSNSGWNRCVFESCREPVSCPPMSTDNLDLQLKGYNCEINKINGRTSVVVNKITQLVKAKSQEKFGAENIHYVEQIRLANYAQTQNAVFLNTFKALSTEYSTLYLRFSNDYIPSYKNTLDALQKWAKYSENAPWRNLVGIRIDIDNVEREESQTALLYDFSSIILQKKIDSQCGYFKSSLEPYKQELSKLNISVDGPDSLCLKARLKLEEIVSYANKRQAQVTIASKRLNESIQKSIQILQHKEVDLQLRQSRTTSAELASAAAYLGEVNRATALLFVGGSTDNHYKLPTQSEVCARIKAFKVYVDECNNAAPTLKWMGTGCIQVTRYAASNDQYLSTAVPRNIQLGLSFISSDFPGMYTQQIQSIKNMMSLNDIEGAAVAYDALLQAKFLEGVQW